MAIEQLPKYYCDYNDLLQIKTEDDLLVMDEATGVRKYIPITITDVNLFKREIEILCKELQHVIDDSKWFAVKHHRLTHYFCIYQTLTEYLTDFLETVHSLHKKVYISIYKCYDDEIMQIFTESLEPIFREFQVIARKHLNFFPDLENYEQIPDAEEIFNQCEMNENLITPVTFSLFKPCHENYISMGLTMSVKECLRLMDQISKDVLSIYQTRLKRSHHEGCIIYRHIKRMFDESFLSEHLHHVARVKKHHLESRRIGYNTESLRKVLDDTMGAYGNYKLCAYWNDNCIQDEEDMEEFVYILSKEKASPQEFENLFKYLGEYKMWEDEIAKADEYERHGDPFFVNWVDPVKLENKLKFWIKGNIDTQQKWYIVWCLMKYTFHMVRDDQDKNAFAARMNQMFPDAEKKCISESFRKMETQMNHNKDFMQWYKDSDPDYNTAFDLHLKLKDEKEYKRDFCYA